MAILGVGWDKFLTAHRVHSVCQISQTEFGEYDIEIFRGNHMGYRILGKYLKNPSNVSRRTLKGRRWVLWAAVISSVGSLAGCSAVTGAKDGWKYNGMWNEMIMGYRTEAWANKSWHSRKHQFCREKHLHEFCEGFRAGYALVSEGGEGCNPAFPPRQYWGWKYQSSEGQAKVAAWYAGYPHGARAAEEDGIGNWTQIQTSTNVQKNFADQGQLGPGQTPGMYPMPAAQPLAAAHATKLKAEQSKAYAADSLMSEAPSVNDFQANQGQLLKK